MPLFKAMHWMPIKLRIKLKFLIMTYKGVNGFAPNYLCEPTVTKRRQRPFWVDSLEHLKIPTTRLKYYGNHFFRLGAVKERNKFLLESRKSPSVESFKSILTCIFLFKSTFSELITFLSTDSWETVSLILYYSFSIIFYYILCWFVCSYISTVEYSILLIVKSIELSGILGLKIRSILLLQLLLLPILLLLLLLL